MKAAGERLVGARFGAVIAAAVVFLVGLGWLVLPQQAPSTAIPKAQRQADGAGQHHAETQAQVPRAVDARSGPTERDSRASPKQDQAQPDGPKSTDVVQALSAAATTLFTGVLTWFAYRQIRISAAQARIARVQAGIARRTLQETAVAAAAAKDSATLARDTLILSQRPWIQVDVSIGGPLRQDENGLHITLNLLLGNTGHTPAFGVYPNILSFLRVDGRPNPRDEQARLAEGEKARRADGLGDTIPPGRKVPVTWTVTIPSADVEAARVASGGAAAGVSLFVVGSVSYFLALSDEPRQTGVMFQIVQLDERNRRRVVPMRADGGDISAGSLELRTIPPGSPYID